MSDIFINYAVENTAIALAIAQGLGEAGYTAWYFRRDILPGPSYLLQEGLAIDQASAIVLLISPNSIGSFQVVAEVGFAHEARKPIIPLLSGIGNAEVAARQPAWQRAIGAVAPLDIPPAGVGAIMPQIIARLEALCSRPGAASSEGAR